MFHLVSLQEDDLNQNNTNDSAYEADMGLLHADSHGQFSVMDSLQRSRRLVHQIRENKKKIKETLGTGF